MKIIYKKTFFLLALFLVNPVLKATSIQSVEVKPTKLIYPFGGYVGGEPLYEKYLQYKGPIKSVTEYVTKIAKKDVKKNNEQIYSKVRTVSFNTKKQVIKVVYFNSNVSYSNEYEYGLEGLPFITLTRESRGDLYKEIKGPQRDRYGNLLVSRYGDKYKYYKESGNYIIKYVQSGVGFERNYSFTLKKDRSILKENGEVSRIKVRHQYWNTREVIIYSFKRGVEISESTETFNKDNWLIRATFKENNENLQKLRAKQSPRRFNITVPGYTFMYTYWDYDDYNNPTFSNRCELSGCMVTKFEYEYY